MNKVMKDKFFEYSEEDINKESAKKFDEVFADLYKELKIEPIIKNENE